MASVTLKGNPVSVKGELPKKGAAAPAFTLTGRDLADVSLKAYSGKRKVLNIVPSLDTPTCQRSARVFNEKASSMDNSVVLDENDRVLHFQLVPEIPHEPDYEPALAVLR